MVQWKGPPRLVTLRLAMLSAERAVSRRPAEVPLRWVAAQDLVREVVRGPGNVLASRQEHNALHGSHGNALVAVARNLVEVGRRRREAA